MPAVTDISELMLDITQTIDIDCAPGDAFRALVERLTTASSTPDGKPMPMVLEEWPGGRWFRDLEGSQGHLWGFVQVIKPPTLLEIQGPLWMSYPVAGHVQFRLTPVAGGVELFIRHQALGRVAEDHREGAVMGWDHFLNGVKAIATK